MHSITNIFKRDVPQNNLRDIRESEGLSQLDLAALADVSIDTISDAENHTRQLKRKTQFKIVNGLNANPNKIDRSRRYELKDVFPNG